jgi:lysophospholipase L1-like esterase
MKPSRQQASSRVAWTARIAAALFLAGGLLTIWIVPTRIAREFAANLLATYLLAWVVAFLFSRVRRKELQLRFVLTTLSATLVIAGLEALSVFGLVDYRSFLQSSRTARTPWIMSGNVADEELLYKRRPHVESRGRVPGNIAAAYCLPIRRSRTYSYDLRYDANGFRNNDQGPGPLAVLGDSFVEAILVPADATLTGQLSQLTGSHVTNLGLSGYGPQQQLALLRRFLPAEARVAVWAFYEGNDPDNMDRYDEELARFRAGATARDRSFIDNALHSLFEFIIDGCTRDERAKLRSADYMRENGDFTTMYFMDRPASTEQRDISRLSQLREILAQAHQTSSDQGVRLVILYIPAKYRIYRNLVEIPPISELRNWPAGDFAAGLKAELRSISPEIGFVDLTPAFLTAAAEGKLLYYLDDVHWTVDGYRLAAETLFDSLAEFGFDVSAATPGGQDSEASVGG